MLHNQIDQTIVFLCYGSGMSDTFLFFLYPYLFIWKRHKDSLLTEECVLEKGVSQGSEGTHVLKCWATPHFISVLLTFCLPLPPSSVTAFLFLI